MATKAGISRHEIEFRFRNEIFNVEQIENIVDLCRIIGKYLYADRNIINARAGKKIGLSYLKKAVEHHIITETQYQDADGKRDIYYYRLGMGGQYLLEKMQEGYQDFSIGADRGMKSRVLTFNYFALEQGYDLDSRYSQDPKCEFFICKKGTICYFPDAISEMQIIRKIIRNLTTEEGAPTPEEIRKKFRFVPVEREAITVGSKSKSTQLFIEDRY